MATKHETAWACDKCGRGGKVVYEDGADVMTVTNMIRDRHNAKSPSCEYDAHKVRVIYIEPDEIQRGRE